MKTILKFLGWTAAMLAVSIGIVYLFWLVLVFLLFGYTFYMWLAIVGEVLLFGAYFLLVRIAE